MPAHGSLPTAHPLGTLPLSPSALYHQELKEQLAGLPRPHPSFLVSLLTREEPAIQTFRRQLEEWWGHIGQQARDPYAARLRSLDNDEFFQAFAEVAIHEIFRYHDIHVTSYPARGGAPLDVNGVHGEKFHLAVQAYLPEVQIRGSMSVYRHLVRELDQIHHHYYFSVYLKRWLPYDFDPRPIKRALEVWLDSLDDGSWHGKYAEYRDENIHLEFSILDKLSEDRRNLVRFRISPLRAPEVLERVGAAVRDAVDEAEEAGLKDGPVVAAIFSNEDWALPENFLQDYLYGKADLSFQWTTHGGRHEKLKAYRRDAAKYGLFTRPELECVSAVVLCDKEWERDKVVFSLRVWHNPWAKTRVPPEAFGEFAQYRPFDEDGDVTYLGWANRTRARFRLR